MKSWLVTHQGTPSRGSGGARTGALGYIMFRVQIEGIPSYDEEQVALVMEDGTKFGHQVPIILGTPTLHRVVRVMKESEIENAPPEWQNIRIAYEMTNSLLSYKMICSAEDDNVDYPMNTKIDPTDIDEKIHLTKAVEIPAFGSVIARGHTEATMMMGHRLKVMTQAPYPEDDANLPVGLYVLPFLHQVTQWQPDGSRSVAKWHWPSHQAESRASSG